MLDQLPPSSLVPHSWIHEQIMDVDDLLDGRSRDVRVPCYEADDFLGVGVLGYSAVHADRIVKEAGEGGICHFGGDGTFVEGIVAFPEC